MTKNKKNRGGQEFPASVSEVDYVKIPKELIYARDLSVEAKLLYAILKDNPQIVFSDVFPLRVGKHTVISAEHFTELIDYGYVFWDCNSSVRHKAF